MVTNCSNSRLYTRAVDWMLVLRISMINVYTSLFWKVWDDDLAQKAEETSATCYYDHSTNLGSDGENIWIGPNTGIHKANDGPNAVQSWYNEIDFYDYNNNLCTPEKECGHYFQVINIFIMYLKLLCN